MSQTRIQYRGGKYLCADCGTELTEQAGKQNVDQLAQVMYCCQCKEPKGEWVTKDERRQGLEGLKAATMT